MNYIVELPGYAINIIFLNVVIPSSTYYKYYPEIEALLLSTVPILKFLLLNKTKLTLRLNIISDSIAFSINHFNSYISFIRLSTHCLQNSI